MVNSNHLPMIAEKGIIKARQQVKCGEGAARHEKRRAHKADRRKAKQHLHRDGEDYEPTVIRAQAWNVS